MKFPEKLLIVEDEMLVAMAMKMELERAGFEVAGLAATGGKALELTASSAPTIILMDVHLPGGLDGIETALTIRQRWDMPIIFLTGYRDNALLERIKSIPNSLHLNKPAGIREIQQAVEDMRADL
jgi:CheY-like chemotaxis protein